MTIRRTTQADAASLMRLFHDTVHTINRRDYTSEQVNAWAPAEMSEQIWAARQETRETFVAETDSEIVGFAELERDGHLDCFYCHKDFQGQGIGTMLLAEVMAEAEKLGVTRLYTEVSITARPFFERRGFAVVKRQEIMCRGVKFVNFQMERKI